jgi:hypothetical protein
MLVILFSCNQSENGYDPNQEPDNSEPKKQQTTYDDGTYCADVTYYNPSTGTNGSYKLKVDVEDNQVIRINFKQGGWLDDSHISPEELDADGNCTVRDEANRKYEIQLINEDCDLYAWFPVSVCISGMNPTPSEMDEINNMFIKRTNGMVTNKMCEIVRKYLVDMRELKGKMQSLKTEVDNGSVVYIYPRKVNNQMICQQIIVRKHGVYYRFTVAGDEQCSMGSAVFNENSYSWQSLQVKENPYDTHRNVYQVRLIESGSNLQELQEKIAYDCTFIN